MREEFDKSANATSKRNVCSVVNGGCTRPSKNLGAMISVVIPISKNVGFTTLIVRYKAHLIQLLLPMLDFEYGKTLKSYLNYCSVVTCCVLSGLIVNYCSVVKCCVLSGLIVNCCVFLVVVKCWLRTS